MPKRVLLVEDEPDIATLMQMILADAGYDVAVAGTLAAARARLADEPPLDLVVLDLFLPDGNVDDGRALALCREIRERVGAPPVIVVTAMVTATARQQAEAAGCARFLSKPFDPDRLLTLVQVAIQDVLDRREERRASVYAQERRAS